MGASGEKKGLKLSFNLEVSEDVLSNGLALVEGELDRRDKFDRDQAERARVFGEQVWGQVAAMLPTFAHAAFGGAKLPVTFDGKEQKAIREVLASDAFSDFVISMTPEQLNAMFKILQATIPDTMADHIEETASQARACPPEPPPPPPAADAADDD